VTEKSSNFIIGMKDAHSTHEKGVAESLTYKLVIFDFDGTLADTFPWFLSVVDQVADAFNLKRIDRNRVDQLRGLEIINLLQTIDVPVWRLASIGAYIRRLMTNDVHRIPLFKGVDQLIEALSDKDVQIALVSSNSYQNVREILGLKIADRINYFECGVSLFKKQTKFKKVLANSGVSSHETICIGDEIRDLKAANAANIPFGAVSWGFTDIEALMALSPNEVFHSVEEIYEKIVPGQVDQSIRPAGFPA
jgi:phosphoglycolate phosphatase